MEILHKSCEMNAKELYRMTKNAAVQKMKDAANTTLKVEKWVHYMDTDVNGKEHEVVSIMDGQTGVVYATNSPTFCRTFAEILEIMTEAGEPLDELEIIEGTSKGGRTFITCGL